MGRRAFPVAGFAALLASLALAGSGPAGDGTRRPAIDVWPGTGASVRRVPALQRRRSRRRAAARRRTSEGRRGELRLLRLRRLRPEHRFGMRVGGRDPGLAGLPPAPRPVRGCARGGPYARACDGSRRARSVLRRWNPARDPDRVVDGGRLRRLPRAGPPACERASAGRRALALPPRALASGPAPGCRRGQARLLAG